MRLTLNLPDDLLAELKRRAEREKREMADTATDLLRKSLTTSELGAPATREPPRIGVDPVTGLPVIAGAPDAPISRMTTEEIYALIHAAQEEEDLDGFAISVRR